MVLAISQVISPSIIPGVLDPLMLPGLFDLDLVKIVLACVKIPDLVKDHGLYGWRGIMAAVIYQARIDAETGDQTAIDWLIGDQCFDFCFVLDFDHANIRAWISEHKG